MIKLLRPSQVKKATDLYAYVSNGATVLARGMFSVVYDNHDGTVTKFTVDESGYYWLTDPSYGMSKLSDSNPYKLPNIEDFGDVGELYLDSKDQEFGNTIYAVRMPKCDRLYLKDLDRPQAAQVRLLKKVMSEATRIQDIHDRKVSLSVHAEEAHSITESEDYEELAQALWYMVGDHDALPDALRAGNIMCYNGHPVVLDPVFNVEIKKLADKLVKRHVSFW